MSRLFFSETGHVIPILCEELTAERRVRKHLSIPETAHPAKLYVLARCYPGCSSPLHLAVNGSEIEPLTPRWPDIYQWHEITLPSTFLKAGDNHFEFWSDSYAMNSWSIAMEDGHSNPLSYVSSDSGKTWRNEKMGYTNVMRGEYVVRIRLVEGEDTPPPAMVWEKPNHPRLIRLRDQLPVDVLSGTYLERVRSICTWVCTRWSYSCSDPGYAPWDADTIMAWGQAQKGAGGIKPIVMCVHFGVTLVTACQAVGIPARCAVFSDSINGTHGHFATEIWFEDLKKWVYVDPTIDAIVFEGEIPLSVKEIQQLKGGLAARTHWGLGRKFQDSNPFISQWVDQVFDPGICFNSRTIWYRTDFLSHPEFSPPWHGTTSYCETGIIIEKADLSRDLGMFPWQLENQVFDLPPLHFPGKDKNGRETE